MAVQKSGSTSSHPRKPKAGRGLKWWLTRTGVLLALVAAGALGWRQLREFRERRMVERARELIAQKDYGQAILSARRALQLNPRDVAVVRMMVELSETAKTKEAIYWRRMLAALEPNSANAIGLADCAIRFNEAGLAEQTLNHVDEAGKKTAAFHNAAGRLALLGNRLPEAEAQFEEAVKLAPEEQDHQVQLAALRLQNGTAEQRTAARELLEKNATNPKERGVVTRALLQEFFREREWDKALTLAQQIQAVPDATFGDRMLYLGLLRRFQKPEFDGYLLTLQELAAGNSEDAGSLITWLAENSLVMIAVDWAKSIPPMTAAKMPIPAALGECYVILRDWESLKNLVTDGNWEYAEFLRYAFYARIQRENDDLTSARNSWASALKSATNRPDALVMLTRYATKWGWESEVLDILWVMARGASHQREALAALQQSYTATGNTRGLLNVATRSLEITPRDVVGTNNLVLLSLLLNTNVDRAQLLADDLYRTLPQNSAIISTYAYALHLRGKTDEGVKLMLTLPEKDLSDPSVAAYLSAMLVETDKPEEAAKYIEIAQAGKLLPEEMELIKVARESLARRTADKNSAQ